jgi:sugar/nucleoside kinase (ribokinase family)
VFAGEAIVDVATDVPGVPDRGGDVLASSSAVTVGGGFNVMAAAARQGLPVLYAGGHGTGPWGDLVRSVLAGEGIGVFRDPDPRRDTGFVLVLVEPDGERTFVTSLGAESFHDLSGVAVSPGDAVYVSGYGLLGPSAAGVAEWAASLPAGSSLFLDPGPLAADIPEPILNRVLPRCDWLSVSLREAALLTGTDDPAAAARLLLVRTGGGADGRTGVGAGVRAYGRAGVGIGGRAGGGVIVRTGASGCVLAVGGAVSFVPAPKVDAVDTTGAGDAHAGAFLAALSDGRTPLAAAQRANVAAALAVTRRGPATAPTRGDLDTWPASGPADPQHCV